jgi:hypothetical protein
VASDGADVLYYVSRRFKAGGSSGLLQKEMRMSREDDFDDIMDSRDTSTGHDDNTEPLLEDESQDESSGVQVETVPGVEPEEEMPPPRRKPTAKKKKKAVKPARKPAKKKTAKKKTAKKKTTAKKKKTRPAAKKKKARKAARKR